MTDTDTLIAQLSKQAAVPTRAHTPAYWGARLLAVLAFYALGAQLFLGVRPDFAAQCDCCPLFVMEIVLLGALLLSSVLASVLAMAPDAYQKPRLLWLPYIVLLALVVLLLVQLFAPVDGHITLPSVGMQGMECALCIAAIALIPAAILFVLLRKGASVRPLQAGGFAVLAASAIGCLTLRIAEANDSLAHVVVWHYLPTLCFAALGAWIGKKLLRW